MQQQDNPDETDKVRQGERRGVSMILAISLAIAVTALAITAIFQ